MSVIFGSHQITNDEIIDLKTAQGDFTFTYPYKEDKYYTVILYDETVEYLHYLAINIDHDNQLEEVVEYTPPKPPLQKHKYILYIFEQENLNRAQEVKRRRPFDLTSFIQSNNLDSVAALPFYVDSRVGVEYYSPLSSGEKTATPMKEGTDEDVAKYCSCIISSAKGDKEEKYNPYAICSKVGSRVQKCGPYYEFDRFNVEQLQTYLRLKGISFKPNDSKETLLSILYKWKGM